MFRKRAYAVHDRPRPETFEFWRALALHFACAAEHAERVREALEFYANAENWRTPSTGFAAQYDPIRPAAIDDGGERARAALADTVHEEAPA
jgi:hypothetical protein